MQLTVWSKRVTRGTNYDLTSNESRNVLNGFLLKLRDISSNYIPNCSIHSRLLSY